MFEWYTEDSERALKAKYFLPGEGVQEACRRLAKTAAEIYPEILDFEEKIYNMLAKGWIAPASPVWANFGAGRGLPISCFSSSMDDNIESILDTHAEVAMLTKMGGGTAGYFGNLRAKNSPLSGGGSTNGPVAFMQMFDTAMRVVSQSNVRRGSFAAYLPIDHPDILDFLLIKEKGNPIQDLSFGVTVKDRWLEEMIAGDSQKREVWAKVLKSRKEKGLPYVIFTDKVNQNAPDVYRDKGIEITHSNLCVTGDQLVVSDRGLKTVKDLYDEGGDLVLFDNEKKVKASPMRLVEKQAPVYKITLQNGMTHTVTDYHKVKVRVKDNPVATEMRQCKDLSIGDKVAIQTEKGIFGTNHMPDEAFLLGLYQADGTQHKDLIMIDIWESTFDLEDEITDKFEKIHYKYGCDRYTTGMGIERGRTPAKFLECTVAQSTVRKRRLSSKTLKKALNFEKGYIPSWVLEGDEITQWQYVRGLFYCDGTVNINKDGKGDPVYLSISNINLEFMKQLQILLRNLGVSFTLCLSRAAGTRMMPNGKGGYSEYDTKTCYRLVCGNRKSAKIFEENTGFLSRKGVILENREYRDNSKKFSKIVSIEPAGVEDVYCTTVDSNEHTWICNGFVTSNCSEILLQTNSEKTFVCCLTAMNLEKYDEWKGTDAVRYLTYFLDAVMEDFIRKAEGMYGLERAVNFAKDERALGLGATGWHSLLKKRMVPFDSLGASILTAEIFEFLQQESLAASKELAELFGTPPLLRGYGRRNSTLMAIAPNTSSGEIIGVSQSIEPDRSNYFTKELAWGTVPGKKCKYLKALLAEKGKDNREVWDSILEMNGSVQHLDFLSDKEKAVFKTFWEIDQYELIRQAGLRQKYIDQGQSLNIFVPPKTSAKEMNDLHLHAWRCGVKGLYYQRSESPTKWKDTRGGCSSCEG